MADTSKLKNYSPNSYPQIPGAEAQYFNAEFAKIKAAINSLEVQWANLAGLASPAFTGTPTAPTAAVNTSTTQLATTAFVLANGPQDGADAASVSGNVSVTATFPSLAAAGSKVAYTPVRTGRLLVIMQAGVASSSGTVICIGAFGTGTPPSTGAVLPGTEFTAVTLTPASSQQITIVGYETLTVGTTYWFDLLASNGSAGVAVTLDNVRILIIEL